MGIVGLLDLSCRWDSFFQALGGPVLAWEIKRGTHRILWKGLQVGYCVWLALQALALLGAVRPVPSQLPNHPYARRELEREIHLQQLQLLDGYLDILLRFQLLLIIAIIPAFTSSLLGQERERGTLFALFGTQLTSRQILLGKLLSRLILMMPLFLTTLAPLVFIATLTSRAPTVLTLALLQEVILAVALGAASLLFAIWIRKTADAVVACYLALLLVFLGIRAIAGAPLGALLLDPISNLNDMLQNGSGWAFLVHLAVWSFLGLVCLRLGWARLRKVCVEQYDRKPPRRLWAFRPSVGNNPIRWRECHVIGLAPLPILRIVPRWLALLGVFAVSAVVAVVSVNNVAPWFAARLLRSDLSGAISGLQTNNGEIQASVNSLGMLFVLSATLLVGVRCGTSVAEEKRRNTWDDLLLTAQSFREITTGKMWGVLQAVVQYIIAYALPVFFLAAAAGPGTLLTAAVWIVLPCAIVYGAALAGIDMVKVPPDMDETREGGAFSFEKVQARRPPYRQLIS